MPTRFTGLLHRFCAPLWKDRKGATAIEYGLIAALVSLAGIAAYSAVGDSLDNVYSSLTGDVEAATPGGSGGTRDAAPSDQIG